MQYNPYIDFVNDTVAKRDLYKKQGKEFFQTLSKRTINSVYGGNINWDVNDQFNCVTENWMRENYDDKVKEWLPMSNDNLIVKLEDDNGVDNQDIAKSIDQMPRHLGSFILGHSKRLMKKVIREIDGFYSNNSYYAVTDSAYIHKKNTGLL